MHILARDDLNLLHLGEVTAAPVVDAGPFQMDHGPGIDHFCTHGEGVDVGDGSVDGVICQVADVVRLGHGGGDGAHEEFGFVHSAVVGAKRVVELIQGAVQDNHVGVSHSCPDTGFDEAGGGGENDIAAQLDRGLDGFLGALALLQVVDVEGLYVVGIGLFEIQAAQLMAVGPAGSLAGLLV